MDDKIENQEFADAAAASVSESLTAELWGFLRADKKWWLLPIWICLFLVGVLIVLSGTGAAPFIYTLF